MKSKNLKRKELLVKFEEEMIRLEQQRKDLINRNSSQGFRFFTPLENRYLYVLSQIQNLTNNIKKEN